jgi:hypothetical protein
MEDQRKDSIMKSMIVLAGRRVNAHVGEEYDVIIEVADEPTTENIQSYANEVMSGIKDLWNQQKGEEHRSVMIYLDAASPFAAMLLNLQIIMKAQDGIEITLPWDKPVNVEELDKESREILKKLEV